MFFTRSALWAASSISTQLEALALVNQCLHSESALRGAFPFLLVVWHLSGDDTSPMLELWM
jgi:hypothetical protein